MMAGKRILFISPIPTVPQTAGNRTRVASLLEALTELGHDVWFLFVRNEPGDEAEMRKRWGERLVVVDWKEPPVPFHRRLRRKLLGPLSPDQRYSLDIDEWYDPALDGVVSRLHAEHRFDVVVCSYVFFSRVLTRFGSDVLRIIDTHDAFANRHRQYLARGETPVWFSTSEAGEAKAFGRADLVFAIQERERVAFSRLTRTPVITLSHITPLNFLDAKQAIPGRMLFVASDNSINVHGIQTFIRESLPLIRTKVAHAHLCLAGSICRAVDDHPGVIKLGRVDALQSAYEQAQVIVNPVLFNTGLSIKNLEALGFGKPLVTATVGTEGMEDGIGTAFVAADSPTELASKCIELLAEDSHRTSITKAAIRYIEQCNNDILSTLAKALNSGASA